MSIRFDFILTQLVLNGTVTNQNLIRLGTFNVDVESHNFIEIRQLFSKKKWAERQTNRDEYFPNAS
jgi:hypothetical protein